MKLGVNLINFGPGADPASLERWTLVAESLGYHFVAISDHVAVTRDVASQYPAPFYDPFTTLAWLAGRTTKMELATTVVILPYRSPLLVARMGAIVDRVSGGRFILGVGVGWASEEFDVLGVPFHERGRIANEYLEAIRELWSHDVASYQGRHVSFEDVSTGPRPLRTPRPPIWVGGMSDAAMRRAVRYGDAWHPINARLPILKDEALPRLREIADEEKRPLPVLCPRIQLRITDTSVESDRRRAGHGTLEQIRSDLATFEEMGCPYILLDLFTGDVEATRRPESFFRSLATLADTVIDLPSGSVR